MVFQAGQGELTAKINADASGFRSGIQSATAALGGFRGALGVASGAVVAFAGAQGLMSAVQSAAQFEEQMLSLRATVGESEANIDSIRESTMNLAAETGQATSMITDGWRFARSAGLEMAEAQNLVETATKASAAGFGEQSQLVRTATTAINAWSSEIESGSDFLNSMTAAAQNADIRVSEMAGAFRRNVNTASELNLSLEETLGSLSAISGAVGSASRGGRLFQQVLVGLQKEIGKSSKSMRQMFGSAENFRSIIEERGLVPALVELQNRLQETGSSMVEFFGSSRRAEGALALVSNEGERAKDIMRQTANATNTVGEAFRDTDGTLRNWRKTQQRFNNLMIEFGTDILPPVNDALETTSNFFSTISGNVQNVSGVIENDLMRNLQNIENMRVGPPDIAENNQNIITQDQFDKIESNIKNVMAELERNDAPEELRKRVQDNLEFAVNAGFENGLSGDQIVRSVRSSANQMSAVIEKNTEKGVEKGQEKSSTKNVGDKVQDSVSSGTKSGVEEGMSQPEFSKMVSSGFKNQIKSQVRPTLEQFQKEDAGALFDPFGDVEEQRRMLRELRGEGESQFNGLSRDIKRTFSRNLSLAMRDGFSSGEEAARQVLQGITTTLTQRLTQNMTDALFNQLSNINLGGGSGGGLLSSIAGGLKWAFADTPGVQEVGPDGSVGAFAPGDKFAAAQSMEDLRAQVGASQQRDPVTVQESTTVQFNVDAVDSQSVSRLFQERSDELAGIITDKIDRRSNIQKAIKEASR